jgi:predicted deacetylase
MRLAIVELHDVSPYYENETYSAIEFLKELGIDKFSLLLIPNFSGNYPITKSKPFLAYLIDQGQEIVLHGLTHRGRVSLTKLLYTNNEGEFYALNREETAKRLEEAIQHLGKLSKNVSFFIPPAWIGNPWLEEVLSAFGFKGVAYRWAIKVLSNGVKIQSPALTFSNRFLLSYLSLKALPIMSKLTEKAHLVRFALHTKDFRDPRKVKMWEKVLTSAKKHRRLISYEELLSEGGPTFAFQGVKQAWGMVY